MRQRFSIAFALLAFLGVLFYQHNPLTHVAKSYSEEVALVAGGTYVSLRGVNALLSTAQEIEMQGGAVVASASVQPLKVLEPIDDMVERVAQAVFVLMVAAGVMAISFAPVSVLGCGLLLASALLLGFRKNVGAEHFAMQIGICGLFFALVLPVTFVSAMIMGDVMTNEAWRYHSQIVESVAIQYQVEPSVAAGEDRGWFSGLSTAKERMRHYFNASKVIAQRADELVSSLIALVSIYIFKMLLLPGIVLLGSALLLWKLPGGALALHFARGRD